MHEHPALVSVLQQLGDDASAEFSRGAENGCNFCAQAQAE
jgi:hypothetical protein